MPDKPPVGLRFSHVYLEKGVRVRDSERFRLRLGSFLKEKIGYDYGGVLREHLLAELGVGIGLSNYGYWLPEFFQKAELRDVLDTITIIARFGIIPNDHREFIKEFVKRALTEEHMAFRLDSDGGVHFFVDAEFEKSRAATLAGLSEPQYEAVRTEYEKAFLRLDDDPPDTSDAIFAMFKSLESLYKLMTGSGGKDRLGYNGAKKKLAPLILEFCDNVPTAKKAVEQAFAGFYDWIEAAQNYRHADGEPKASPAPLDFTIHMIATGSSYLRWLLAVHANAQGVD